VSGALKKINIQGVVQGDLLFTEGDLTKKSIGGKQNITFTPNTITYAVEEGTDLSKQIETAKVGIIFHTSYVGDALANMDAQAGADVESFSRNPDVFFDNASYKDVSGSAKFTQKETAYFMGRLTI